MQTRLGEILKVLKDNGFEVYHADKWAMVRGNCFEVLQHLPENSVHSIVTDPPYSIEEFSWVNLEKLKLGRGGVWRIPPKIGGYERSPLPRFTIYDKDHYRKMYGYFYEWGKLAYRVLVPGGHVFIATTQLFLHVVASALFDAGFEVRGVIARLVATLRGGFRPKGAEEEFKDVSTMPRSHWEPWILLRKPLEEGLTIAENLRKWKAGGLRRNPDGTPFIDVIPSETTPKEEKKIAPHPTLKPQSFMRRLVWVALPLGDGIILDPFAGAGSTIAAAVALGYEAIGIEIVPEYYSMAIEVIPKLASLKIDPWKIEKEIRKHGKSKIKALMEFVLSP